LQWRGCSHKRPLQKSTSPKTLSITEVDSQGKPVSDTNVIPFKNTTALIRDLAPGKTYEVRCCRILLALGSLVCL